MKNVLQLAVALFLPAILLAQKKPLEHSVYDGWKSAGERSISSDGKWVVYSINPQEGDGTMYIHGLDNSFKKEIPRGYLPRFSENNKYLVFKIRPAFKDTRDARIKKKRPDEMPKDTLGIMELGLDSVRKIPRVKNFKTPEKGDGVWIAYHLEKALSEPGKPKAALDSLTQLNNLTRMADSLMRVVDSIRNKANEAKIKGLTVLQAPKKDVKPATKPTDPVEEGTELILYNLVTKEEKKYPLVAEYFFSEPGNVLLIETTRKNSDTLSQAALVWVSTSNGKSDTIFRKFNDAKSYAIDEAGTQLAFVAERDSAVKALTKFYKLYYFKAGNDSATLRADRNTDGVVKGLTVSPDYNNQFSQNGNKLFFGLTQIRKPKDTTLVDFETARLDVWHYNDDYLQPQQLVNASQELRRSYLAVFNGTDSRPVTLGAEDAENVSLADEGNADFVMATSSKDSRVSAQWEGFARQTAYLISTKDGSRKKVSDKLRAFYSISPKGRFVLWYDWKAKNYFTYNVESGVSTNISKDIKFPLWDEEDDHPDDPPPHGAPSWTENDQTVLIYDKYDIWEVDPQGKSAPVNITHGIGRATKAELRYVRTDNENRFIKDGEQVLLRSFNFSTKYEGFYTLDLAKKVKPVQINSLPASFNSVIKAKKSDRFIVQKSNINESELFWTGDLKEFNKLTDIAQQQKDYNWLSAELVKWKMFDGKESEGLLFKPENFDPKKKYPVIFYFYERDADGLYNYRTPAPSASTINIPYFVSNGYLVFDPNIYYKDGNPGESAYNSVVSAAKVLSKLPYVDSTKMAIQGQSWGGYQVAYLVTRTKMFAAAGAGAPVANMTSAYGGIRWGSGLNRQFQYEHSQSRIGGTLWQKRDLYIKNSPLFTADKVTTPILIMHNDKDGAVPWYQGIEYFTALRRLNKKVWMLQYNDEDHNLVERRNRKDLSIRLSQFFDYHLKGAPPAKWITDGVPATVKGIEWGTETSAEKKAF
ncbi:MAG: S9 family peptidase [Chitinophagaceae bacterium]|nr:S9 family peptidase [Chitinophagaceae bacterium]